MTPLERSTWMIRDSRAGDIDAILDIRLSASIQAHDFIDSAFWISKVGDMRDIYLPASQTLPQCLIANGLL